MPTLASQFRPVNAVRPILLLGDPRVIGLGLFSALIFLFVFVDALMHTRASYDLWALQSVQKINAPWRDTILPRVEHLTDSNGAVLAWIVVLGAFAVLRRWTWACVVALIPIGGVINLAFSSVVTRARPHLDELLRSSLNPEERSFPSGHVMGAVMLYGIVFVAVGELRSPVVRLAVRLSCIGIIAIAGFQRLWVGAHWPSDVLGGYALGGLLLACLLLMRGYLIAEFTSPASQSVKTVLRAKVALLRAGLR
jgi:membrane-associated phospholipid phosphatase